MTYKVEGKLTVDDLKEISLKVNRRTPLLAAFLSTLISILIIWVFFDNHSSVFQWIAFFTIFLLTLVLFLFYFIWIMKKSVIEYPEMLETFIYIIKDTGVGMQNPKGRWFFPWSDIKKTHETKRMFVVTTMKKTNITIPKRFFKDNNELNNVRELLNNNT